MPEPVWGAVGTVIAALLVYAGAKFTARQSSRVAEKAADNDGEHKAFERLSTYTDRLEKRFDALEERVEKQDQRIETLEQQLDRTQRLLKTALTYIERLLDFIADHMPGALNVPQPPGALHQHLGHEVVDNWRLPPPADGAHQRPERPQESP